jgi:hypothetical protein
MRTRISRNLLGIGKAPCPNCGQEIKFIPPRPAVKFRPFVLCGSCSEYQEISKDGFLESIGEDRISDEPCFVMSLPWNDLDRCAPAPLFKMPSLFGKSEIREVPAVWPSGCCICGKEATTRDARSVEFQNHAGNKWFITIRISGVPYCEDHKKMTGVEIQDSEPVLRFRSFRYYKAFRAVNSWDGGRPTKSKG